MADRKLVFPTRRRYWVSIALLQPERSQEFEDTAQAGTRRIRFDFGDGGLGQSHFALDQLAVAPEAFQPRSIGQRE
jgi:hypothetical protein